MLYQLKKLSGGFWLHPVDPPPVVTVGNQITVYVPPHKKGNVIVVVVMSTDFQIAAAPVGFVIVQTICHLWLSTVEIMERVAIADQVETTELTLHLANAALTSASVYIRS